MIVGLSIVGGFVLGIGTLPASGPDGSAVESGQELAAALPASVPVADDPATAVYEPFVTCSADYADGPGADLDRGYLIGPDNSVMVSPEQLIAMGLPAADVEAQARAWDGLSPEQRQEQLCRAAQQTPDVVESR
ncbi:hypothetical protein ITX31_14420 [Arthrobacter gandavensis]|uniref:hypothetical protein n=1 Tax=Arthrobacter gandavensis TaxID=169960 RepID=UPI0018908883|nr:hypothetical protein [Arthrobacter gandavensis]MBF4995299.1 hypothetical protein [Arthrobacter gandavensis]